MWYELDGVYWHWLHSSSSGFDDGSEQRELWWRGRGGGWRPLWHGGGFLNVSIPV